MGDVEKIVSGVNGTTRQIKSETPFPPTTRLLSFKEPRDLTLGGSKPAKKSFVPNLNVVRNRNRNLNASEPNTDRDRGKRGKKNDTRPQRAAPKILKAGGVFSEGIAASTKHGPSRPNYGLGSGNGGGGDSTSTLRKPTLNLKNDWKVDKEFHEEDDEEMDDLLESHFTPTRLPININVNDALTKEEWTPKVKKEFKESKDAFEMLQDSKPLIFLMQFPDCLPGRGPDDNSSQTENKPDISDTSENNATTPSLCTTQNLEEGQIGKILLYKSGKVKLKIGNVCYDLSLGSVPCFRQDVMSVAANTEERSGLMINMGPIENKLIAIPDWEKMFEEMETS